MLKGAVIGISGYGNVHYTDLLKYHKEGRIRLAGATVINRNDEQEKCAVLESVGCKIYGDYLTMLDDLSGKIDFCTIPTGILYHREMTVAALGRKINVLVEKPAAPDMASVEEMKLAEKRSGCFAAVGFQYNYQESTARIKEAILSGRIGRVLHLRGICLWPRNSSYYARNGWSGKMTLRGIPVNDNPFSNATAHYLMLLLYFAGDTFESGAEPVRVSGRLLRANPAIESCDAAELHYLLNNGLRLDYTCAHSCRTENGPVLEIIGEKGTIRWTQKIAEIRTDSGVETIPVAADLSVIRNRLWNAFFDRLSGKNSFVTSLELAGLHTKAVELAVKEIPLRIVPDPEIITENDSIRYVIPDFEREVLKKFGEPIWKENI